jgi:hypothetical protein
MTTPKNPGVKGLVDELLNAFDSSLRQGKLLVAALTGAGLGVFLLLDGWLRIQAFGALYVTCRGLVVLAFLGVLSLGICLLTQMTFIEMSRRRPATRNEIRAGLLGNTLRLALDLALLVGLLGGLLALFRWLPDLVHSRLESGALSDALQCALLTLRLLLEVIVWPIFVLALLLLGPIVVIEETSALGALLAWLSMLRQHLGRIYLYEALALAIAGVLTLPLLIPILLASNAGHSHFAERATLQVLAGVALTPMLAYVFVANVFIYLNLRYEFQHRASEK